MRRDCVKAQPTHIVGPVRPQRTPRWYVDGTPVRVHLLSRVHRHVMTATEHPCRARMVTVSVGNHDRFNILGVETAITHTASDLPVAQSGVD